MIFLKWYVCSLILQCRCCDISTKCVNVEKQIVLGEKIFDSRPIVHIEPNETSIWIPR